MPVVSRRPNKQQGPSGLDKFLQTIGVVAGIGNQVGNFIQNRKQLGLQQEGLALQGRNVGINERNIALGEDAAADTDAMRVFEMGINRLTESRNRLLIEAQNQGSPVDPRMANAAPVLGDESDPLQREVLRKAAARIMGVDPSEISDRFILSPTNLMSEASRDISGVVSNMAANLQIGALNADPAGARAAASRGAAASMSGIAGASFGQLTREEAFQNQLNELFRVSEDPDTGEATIDGAFMNNALPAIDQILNQLGLPPTLKEIHPSQMGLEGPDLIVSGPIYDEYVKSWMLSAFSTAAQADRIERESAAGFVEEFNMSFEDALHAVRGEYDQMTVGNQAFYDSLTNMNRAMVEFLGNTDPMTKQLIILGQVMSAPGPEGWGLPADQVLGAVTAVGAEIQKSNPGFKIPTNLNPVARTLNSMFGGTGQGWKLGGPSGPILNDSTSTRFNGMRDRPNPAAATPDSTQADAMLQSAWNATIEQLTAVLRAIPDPEQRRATAMGMTGLTSIPNIITGDTIDVRITPAQMEELLRQIP